MEKKYKFFVRGLLIFVITLLCITVISFFLKDSSNYSGFIGNVVGAVISGIITIFVLFITIKRGNEEQKESLNMQSALQAENNLRNVFEEQKKIMVESANQLDELLFTVQILKVSGSDGISEERKNLINIFSNYHNAMNTIKLNTDVYIDTSKCDGCTDCEIKSYGELSKRKTKLWECFNNIEYSCNLMFENLRAALDISIDTQALINQNAEYRKTIILYEEQIKNCKDILALNPNDNERLEKLKQYESEYTKLAEQIRTIDIQIQAASNDIGEKNKKARYEANNIQMRDRNELHNAIMKYFDVYRFYIRENKNYVMKNGTLFQNKCKKYDID